MPSTTQKKETSAKKKTGIDIQIHCKKCGKDPYDCKCNHPYEPQRMDKIAARILSKLKKNKKSLTTEQKQRVLKALRSLKEEYTSNIGGETDITNADNLQVNEDEFTNGASERNVVAKTFDTKADFESYVNQRRGIEMTQKEQQAILGWKNAKPTQQDRFFVKYETTDDFGNNDTTIIKKLKDGSQFVWTAFSKHETAEEEGKPNSEEDSEDNSMNEVSPSPMAQPVQSNSPSTPPPEQPDEDVIVDDPIRITKTITFVDDSQGANILGDFLRKLDI